ncbi:MAG: hypothetical protein V3T58_06795 [Candidatus Hydrothermarchaeales archaeon]
MDQRTIYTLDKRIVFVIGILTAIFLAGRAIRIKMYTDLKKKL